MPEMKKRTFESDVIASAGLRLSAQPASRPPGRAAHSAPKRPDASQQQRQELVCRLIEYLKNL